MSGHTEKSVMSVSKTISSLTNASITSLVNGTVDSLLNRTFVSLLNTTYNKNGTEGAVVQTVLNLIQVALLGSITVLFPCSQSERFRPVVLPLVLLAVLLLGGFLWWKKLGCCSCCCLTCLQPRGLTKCGACQTCQYVVEGAMIKYTLHNHYTLYHHHP